MKTKAVSVLLSVFVVFTLVVGAVTLRLRSLIRAEMLERERSVLHAVSHFEAARGERDPLGMVLGLVDLEGMIGIRLYSMAGEPVTTLPARLTTGTLPEETLEAVRGEGTFSRLEPNVLLDTVFADPLGELTQEPVPLLRVLVKLEPERLQGSGGGYVEFLVDGTPMAAAFRDLDHALLAQSAVALGVGGGIMLTVLLLSLLRLEHKNRELAQANRDLTLHLKAAAIGSISAHLFHRLKHAVGDAAGGGGAEDLQDMVQEVLELFQDEELGLEYEFNGREILDLAVDPLEALARDRGVTLHLEGGDNVQLRNRHGNLLALAVQNVVRNAIEASPDGCSVDCSCTGNEDTARIRVTDQGAGLGEDERRYLFEPGYSSKVGGHGLGLSISRQLCRLIGGELRLVGTGESGTTFEVSVAPGAAARGDD